MIRQLVRKNVRGLTAYQAKEIACRVKLDANESPYDFPKALGAVRKVKTNRYPDPEAKELRQLLAKQWGVKAGNILHGNGSDELIYALIATFGGPVLFPTPTFSMYGIIATVLGEKPVGIPLDAAFGLDAAEMLGAVRRYRPKLVFLSSPNNPTGNSFEPAVMSAIIRQSRGIVVVDEAYQMFSTKKSFLPLLRKHRNLVVMRTLSKIGLAALRTGFIAGDPALIGEVNKVRLPFNVNALSQAVALSALCDTGKMDAAVAAIVRERDRLFRVLARMDGVLPYPSDANFILFRVKDADAVQARLLERGVLVRNLSGTIRGGLRVTVGTPRENRAFLSALGRVLGAR